jgi:hypothetical protein
MRINNIILRDKMANIIINDLDKIKDRFYTNKIVTNLSSEYKWFSDMMYLKNK